MIRDSLRPSSHPRGLVQSLQLAKEATRDTIKCGHVTLMYYALVNLRGGPDEGRGDSCHIQNGCN